MKIKNSTFILFLSLSNILIISEISSSLLFNNYGNNSWLVIIIYLLFVILISLLFNGFNINITKYIKKKYLVKLVLVVYLYLSIVLMIFLTSVAIKNEFYPSININIIITTIAFCTIYVGCKQTKEILGLSAIFYIVILSYYVISFSFLNSRNFSLLLPISIDYKSLYKSYLIIMFPLENIIYSIQSDNIKNGFSRKTFVLGNVFTFLYLLFIFIDSITILGGNFHKGINFGSFMRWKTYQGNKFIESFNVFLMIIMILSIIFRLSLNINTLRRLTLIKKKSFILIFSISLLIGLIFLNIYINIIKDILRIVLKCSFFLILFIYIYFTYLSYKLNKVTLKGIKNV